MPHHSTSRQVPSEVIAAQGAGSAFLAKEKHPKEAPFIDVTAFLRLPEVMALTGLARSTVYALASRGDFPPPVKLGNTRASAWPSDEIAAWLEESRRERDQAA